MTWRSPTVPGRFLIPTRSRSQLSRSGSGQRLKRLAIPRSWRTIGIGSIGMGPTTCRLGGRRLEVLDMCERLSSLTHLQGLLFHLLQDQLLMKTILTWTVD